MPLTKFVRNVSDLSDSGGFKFRFCCDHCGDGFESQYISSSSNLLKTGLEIFQMFKPLGGLGGAADNIDRGLRGKERDAAYEKAVHEAMAFFQKCPKCGKWVCPEECWNGQANLCVGCAPNAENEAAAESAQRQAKIAVENARQGARVVEATTCPVCKKHTAAGKFCTACGASLTARFCRKCHNVLGQND